MEGGQNETDFGFLVAKKCLGLPGWDGRPADPEVKLTACSAWEWGSDVGATMPRRWPLARSI